MSEVDFAMNWHFRYDGHPRNLQMRFRRNWAPADSATTFDGTGQLVAVVINPGGPDHEHAYAISRPGVTLHDVEATIAGWERWAWISGPEGRRVISLNLIGARLAAAGLA